MRPGFIGPEFQGYYTNQAYYKSGSISPEYQVLKRSTTSDIRSKIRMTTQSIRICGC